MPQVFIDLCIVYFKFCLFIHFCIAAAGAVVLFQPQTKTNSEDEFPKTNSNPKTNCEDIQEAEFRPKAEFPGSQIAKSNSRRRIPTRRHPKTNCADELAGAKLPPEAEFLPNTNCKGSFPKPTSPPKRN